MDDKARFQKIQSQLERYLYEYKNSFPKNIWQIIGVDLPFVIMIISVFVVIRVLGFGIWALVLVILMLLPYILMWSTQSNSIWTKIWKKRKTYRADNQAILDKIHAIDTSEFEQYPDVKRYLENYQSELAAETIRKESIAKSHKKIMIIGSIIIVAGALLTYTTETRIKLFHPTIVDKNEKPQSQEKEPLAVISPLNRETKQMIKEDDKTLKIYFREFSGVSHYLRIKTPQMSTTATNRFERFRLFITDTTGHPIKNIPYFDFKYLQYGTNSPIIESYPITINIENHPYEIIRRVRYLQENADNLRYVIEGLD
ncbi:MAG: hypothetical protein PUC50_03990 [Bacteroidales bacterium]|nr:hypothetical protein [Bacteroidales bacterium]